jgi:tetratricopeptide (TPR) repeat protein
MKPKTPRPAQSARSIIITYYFTLALLVIGAFFPDGRVWGFNWWHFVPLWTQITLAMIGLAAPILAHWISKRELFNLAEPTPQSGKQFWTLSACGIATLGVLFWLGRNQTYFLGDGYQVLTFLQQGQSTHKLWDMFTLFIQRRVFSLFGGQTADEAKLALQLISVVSGVGLIALTLVAARKLGLSLAGAWILAAGLFTSGASLLFFGYIETYPLFVSTVTATCLIGLLVSEKKISRWWLLPFFIVALALHLFAVALTPAILYLWLRPTKLWQRIVRIRLLARLCAAVGLITAIAATLVHLAQTNYVLRFWFIPPVADRFTVESYTLFSLPHLADMLNLLFLLLPSLPLLFVVIFQTRSQELSRRPSYRFLTVAFFCCLAMVFVLDPKLGMPRDWDLFSFAGIPIVMFWYLFLLDQRVEITKRITVLMLSLSLGAIVLIPRAVIFASQDHSVQMIKSYVNLDHTKSKNLCFILGQELERWGRVVEATETFQLVNAQYPEIAMNEQSQQQLNEGRVADAISMTNQALHLNPIFPDAYSNLGTAYLASGQLNDALEQYRISYGLNPGNVKIRFNLANVYARFGNTSESRLWLERSLDIDSSFSPAIVGMAIVAVAENRSDEIPYWLDRLSAAQEVEPVFVGDLVRQLLRKNLYDLAARAITIGQEHGVDSTTVAGFVRDFPRLAKYLR